MKKKTKLKTEQRQRVFIGFLLFTFVFVKNEPANQRTRDPVKGRGFQFVFDTTREADWFDFSEQARYLIYVKKFHGEFDPGSG